MAYKYDPRTPAYKRKQTPKATPSSSRSVMNVEYISKKQSKPDFGVSNIEDEEFPKGFTLLNTPGKPETWKTMHMTKSDKENCDTNSDGAQSNSSQEFPTPASKESGGTTLGLSLIANFDEIIRCYEEFFENDLSEEFLEFAEHQELCRLEWLKSTTECKRLQTELEKANHEIGDFSNKLKNARRLLDQEKKLRRRAEAERNTLEQQMSLARDLLFSDKSNRLPDDTREKLAFLNNTSARSHTSFDRNNIPTTGTHLNTINEVNSNEINTTGSLMTDCSYSRSEDGLDVSTIIKPEWKRLNHASNKEDVSPPKKRKSERRSSAHKVVEINPTDKIVATTTLSVSKEGPITATSVIEAIPQDEEMLMPEENEFTDRQPTIKLSAPPVNDIVERLWLEAQSPGKSKNGTSNKKQHSFMSKAIIRPDNCRSCNHRIRFGKLVLKCKDCKALCHMECKHDLPLPCVPLMNTPTQKGVIGIISDFAPTIPPMVPALIVHCINEIELRGLNEVGIYRVPGSEKDVKSLKDKFLRSKSVPNLNDIDVHVICGVVKDFLRSLREPLVTSALWKDFVQATQAKDHLDIMPALYQTISHLPQANRDTLAYVMLHLNKVAQSKDCKMPVSNLAKVFAPTIVGYSSQDVQPHALLLETRQQFAVMEYLLNIPQDFWISFTNLDTDLTTPRSKMLQTPSTESLSRVNIGKFFTPTSAKSVQGTKRRHKFFPTPPSKK